LGIKKNKKIMKKSLALISILIINTFVFAQVDSSSVPFVAYWHIGDTYTFSVNKSYEQINENGKVIGDSLEYKARFKVLDSTETSYTIQWSFLDNKYLPIFVDDSIKHLTPELAELEVIYKTSETGEFIGILNWEEIASKFNSYYSQLLLVTNKNSKLQNKVLSQISPIKNAIKSKAGIEQFVFKELTYFHFPFGAVLPTNQAFYYEDEFPNIFGGDPLRGNSKVEFELVDYDEEYCRFRQNSFVNQEDAKQMLIAFIKKNYSNSKQAKNI